MPPRRNAVAPTSWTLDQRRELVEDLKGYCTRQRLLALRGAQFKELMALMQQWYMKETDVNIERALLDIAEPPRLI